MTATEFREALARLGWTQRAFAREIGAGERTVHRWAAEGPPALVERLLVDSLRSAPHRPVARSDGR